MRSTATIMGSRHPCPIPATQPHFTWGLAMCCFTFVRQQLLEGSHHPVHGVITTHVPAAHLGLADRALLLVPDGLVDAFSTVSSTCGQGTAPSTAYLLAELFCIPLAAAREGNSISSRSHMTNSSRSSGMGKHQDSIMTCCVCKNDKMGGEHQVVSKAPLA
mgnify:CR=1 FL=1